MTVPAARTPLPAFLVPPVLAALALVLSGPASAQGASADDSADLPFDVVVAEFTEDPEAARVIAATRAAWVDAFESQDLERMMAFYVDDIYSYDLMAAPEETGPAMAFDGEPIWRANWVGFFELFEDDLKVTIDDLTVYQSGDIATVRGLTRLEGTAAGGQFYDLWVRETNVLRRIEDEWLVVHDHVSVPIDFARGEALMGLAPAAR